MQKDNKIHFLTLLLPDCFDDLLLVIIKSSIKSRDFSLLNYPNLTAHAGDEVLVVADEQDTSIERLKSIC
jgi:hypothetical protein